MMKEDTIPDIHIDPLQVTIGRKILIFAILKSRRQSVIVSQRHSSKRYLVPGL